MQAFCPVVKNGCVTRLRMVRVDRGMHRHYN